MWIAPRHLIALSALILLAIVLLWQNDEHSRAPTAQLDLPEQAPDLYIQGVRQTRYNPAGAPVMRTRSNDLAYYQDRRESILTEPVVFLLNRGERNDWRIDARRAVVDDNGDAVFTRDVRLEEQSATPPWVMTTQWLKVEQEGTFATTEEPVRITQGRQVATSVGMDAELVAKDTIVTLKSEVAIHYESPTP